MTKEDFVAISVFLLGLSISIWVLTKVVKAVAVIVGQLIEALQELIKAGVGEIQRPSHLLYLSLFGVGAVGSASRVIEHFGAYPSPEPAIKLLLFCALWAFFTTNILQQYLIYRTCIAAEVDTSDITKTYGTWWVGTATEKVLRLVVVGLLLSVAGEVYHFEGAGPEAVVTIARLNIGLFLLFVLWNVAALLQWKPKAGGAFDDAEKLLRKRARNAVWLDAFAAALWAFVLISMGSKDYVAFIILTAVLYAFLVVVIHVRQAPWNRSVFLGVVGSVFFISMTSIFYPAFVALVRSRLVAFMPSGLTSGQ